MKALRITGVLGAIAVALTLAACGGSSGSSTTNTNSATPRQYTDSAIESALAGPDSTTTNTSGSPVTDAACTDKNVNSNGVGSYSCDLTFQDGSTQKALTVTINSSGTIVSAG